MPINYVNGGVTDLATLGTMVTINYSPLADSYVSVSLYTNTPVTAVTCVDSYGNPLTIHPNALSEYFMFYGQATAGVTGYTFSWTTNAKVVVTIGEYSGVSGIGATGHNTQSSTAGTVSVITTAANSWCPAMIGSTAGNITFTTVTGNQREQFQTTGLAASICSGDNTVVASGGTCTFAQTLSITTAWHALAVEFLAAVVPQMFDYQVNLVY